MIKLTVSLLRSGTPLLSNGCVSSLWKGRSVQNILQSQKALLSDNCNKDDENDPASYPPLPLPKEPSSGPPDYLKRGSPLEISMRPDFSKCDDHRTEEERERDAEAMFNRLAAKGLILTAEQAAKKYPDSPYFKKEKKDK